MSQIAFRYRALDAHGAPTRGRVQAKNQQDAYRHLTAAGMRPLTLVEDRPWFGQSRGKVTLKDLSYLTHQLSILTESRIPLVDGLRSMAEQEPNASLRNIITQIADQIEAGHSMTEALAPHRELFGDAYVQTMRAAERTGNVSEVLSRLATMLERQYEAAKSVKGALMYPVCVVLALAFAVAFLMIFVVPRMAQMFSNRGVALPLPTQLVIGFSAFLRGYWYLCVAGIFGGIWGFRRAWRHRTSRERIDGLFHRLPFVRDILRGYAISRFTTVLAISLRSGLNLIEALDLGGLASGRPLLQKQIQKLRDQVNSGGRMAEYIGECSYLPALSRRMLATGEESGDLPKLCDIVSNHYEREVAHLAKNVTTVIEPVLIIGLAAIVLIVALAIFLPMWNMGTLVG